MKKLEQYPKYLFLEDGTILGPRGNPLSYSLCQSSKFYTVKLFNAEGKRVLAYPHRLVYSAHFDIPEGFIVKHKDGNRQNNALTNLEAVTKTSNAEEKKVAASIRNKRYKQKGGDRVKTLQDAARKAYRERLLNDPAYADKYELSKIQTRERIQKWIAENPERFAEGQKRRRQEWEKKFPHLATAKVQKRNAAKLKATPSWADNDKINNIYRIAHRISTVTGIAHHVDHVIPLRGKLVCGLHVPENLMVVAYDYNCSKSNHYEIN